MFNCCIELDENYFGSVRKRKQGKKSADKIILFDILKSQAKVYTALGFYTKTN